MKARTIQMSQVSACPKHSLLPQHYRDDGTCECPNKAENQERYRELNEKRKQLRAEHKMIVKQMDELKRKM